MSVDVRLPFDSHGNPVAITQSPGGQDPSHGGVLYTSWDFDLAFGDDVLAIAPGTVVDVRETVPDGGPSALPNSDGDGNPLNDDLSLGSGATGNLITIKHVIGGIVFYSTYLHLKAGSVPVEVGATVVEGQPIGKVGYTGARTGDHLHLQVGVDPISFGATNYGNWPLASDNGKPQTIADASNTTANAHLVSFKGYGTDLPASVIGPPPPNPPHLIEPFWSFFVDAANAIIKFVFENVVVPIHDGFFQIAYADTTVVQTLSTSDSNVTFSGNTVQIHALPLVANEQYHVTIAPNAIMSASGALFAGVSDSSLKFTAVSSPPPSPPPLDPPVFTEGRDIAHIPDGGGPYDALGGDDVLIGSPGLNRVVFGGSGNDTFYAGGKGSHLVGGSGDDWFIANVSGSDNFWGDEFSSPLGGNDTVDFSNFPTAVTVDLPNGIATANGIQYGIQTANVAGGSADDTMQGTDLDNRFIGNGGNDSLTGNGGNDVLLGGAGNDTLNGGTGGDLLYGDDGQDGLDGGSGNDYLDGGAGNDTIYGGTGNDTLVGGLGDDGLFGEDGDDMLVASAGTDWLRGLDGTDTIDFSQAPAGLTGGGAQIAVAGWGVTTIDGVEIFIASTHDDNFGLNALYQEVYLGAGNDRLTVTGLTTVYGDDGNDQVFAFNVGRVYGGAGDDDLRSMQGDAEFFGDDGNDKLFGGSGINTLHGGAGDDQLFGAGASNTLFGDGGADQLFGDSGGDYLDGGLGADILHGYGGVDSLNGGDGADIVFGEDGNDSLYGGAGNDRLDGGAGDDGVFGEDGDDTLVASVGTDWLRGLDGTDTVDFSQAPAGLTGGGAQITVAGWGTTTIDGVEIFIGSTHDDNFGLNATYHEVHLGAGNDRLTAQGLATVYGDDGNDQIFASDGVGRVYGGAGDDDLRTFQANNEFFGDDGNDKLFGGSGINTLHGGAGDDQLFGAGASNTLFGDAGADQLFGDGGADTLNGGADDDRLDGGAGGDAMSGGSGNDTYYVDNAADQVIEAAGGGSDNVYASTNFVLGAGQEVEYLRVQGSAARTLTGNELANYLIGGAGNDALNAGAGDDKLDGKAGADAMSGGSGNDTYYVDNAADQVIEAAGGGSDTINTSTSFALGVGQEVEYLRVLGSAGLTLTGNELANSLIGGAGNDTLNAGAGNDTLDGKAGADAMAGGTGNDTYYVDNAADQVIEAAGGGTDTVYANTSFALGAGQEVEYLRVQGMAALTLTGNELANYMIGGAGNDTLNAGAGDDKLDGAVGGDAMSGGSGNDTYYVDNAADQVIEAAGGGSDNIYASTNFELGTGQEIEYLRVYGSAARTLTGNELANYLIGGAGNDTLNGGAGDDKLDGKVGADAMAGGTGNDSYYIDNVADQVIEAAGGGSDTVYASKSFALGAGQEVEYLRVLGSAALTLTGNELANSLIGGAGNDTLNGGVGDDKLDGGVGGDVMAGGTGNDIYYVDNAADQVIEAAGGGTDNVYASANFTLGAGQEVEYLRVQGSPGLTLTGNELANYLIGGASNDTLNAGAGNDTLNGGAGADVAAGGAGNDLYYVNNAADQVIEAMGGGTDTVYASTSFALGAGQEVEYLRVQGPAGLTLTGNEFANSLVGGAGNDLLDGGAAIDILSGGGGADTFVFNANQANGDRVTDFAGINDGGHDRLEFVGYEATASFTALDATHWRINDSTHHETIVFSNAAHIAAGDYFFI